MVRLIFSPSHGGRGRGRGGLYAAAECELAVRQQQADAPAPGSVVVDITLLPVTSTPTRGALQVRQRRTGLRTGGHTRC